MCPIKITTTIWPPFISFSPRKIPKNFTDGDSLNLTTGVEIEILQTIARKINFLPTFRLV